MIKPLSRLMAFALLFPVLAWADIINVPADQPTIQAGIDAASDGDEVVVAMGTYHEVINFDGKAITIRSSDGPEVTTIDGSGFNQSVVRCTVQTKAGVQLEGFTITGGYATSGGGVKDTNCHILVHNCIFRANRASFGGAIRISGLYDPVITDCIFIENIATEGAGIWILDNSPTITDCIFVANDTIGTMGGTGIYAKQSNAVITGCVFTQNRTDRDGGGMNNWLGAGLISGCSFLSNYVVGHGSAIYNVNSSDTAISNSFFCGNTGHPAKEGVIWGDYVDGGGNEFLEECPITGGCCVKGVCAILTADLCTSFKGEYQGDDTECDDTTCSEECPADFNDDGEVGPFDLATLLGNWGPCP